MKKFYLLLILLVSVFGYGQINLVGDTKYKLNIVGYQSRDSDGCGDIDGLIYIRATYQDGNHSNLFQGRKIYQPVDHEETFTKNNPIVNLEFHKVVRWETTFGCNGGPNRNYDNVSITNTCFSSYQANAGSELRELTVTVKPVVVINKPAEPQYLGDTGVLKIELPDNLTPNYYNWKYRVGTEPEKDIPAAFNNKPVLNIKGEDFLKAEDFGKIIYVWVNMNCNAGSELAKGYARREAYYKVNECTSKCRPSFPITNWIKCIQNCATNYTTHYNEAYTDELEKTHQSLNSNEIPFTYLKTSPVVTSALPANVSCYDFESKDGSVKIQFDKSLLPQEKLNYTLINADTGTPVDVNGAVVMDGDKFMTRNNLARGNYEFQLIGFYDGYNTRVPTEIKTYFTIGSPSPVDFNLSKTNVKCNGGKDGTITINASGGTGKGYQYSVDNGTTWIPFSNTNSNTHTINGLYPISGLSIDYAINVKDMNGCVAKIQKVVDGKIELGAELSKSVTIEQPANAVYINYTLKNDPTFYGAANGKLVAAISGGTINDDKSYSFEWKNSIGVVMPATAQYNSADNTYNITLENAPEGEYKLTVKDKNYNNAINKEGCSIIESSQILTQPEKIKITLQETQPISCNTENSESDVDKFSDGILKATVSGGIQFTGAANNGLPYTFIWSKYNTITGFWEELSEHKTATAENLSQGNYSLNIIDANGIVQGTYNTTDLVTAIPTTKEMVEPTKLELSFNSGNVSCHVGNNGWAQANVTGGSSPYTYTWYNTGEGIIDVNKISHLTAGTYTVEVIDAKGCFTKGSIVISEPEFPVAIEYIDIFTPTFSGATNGRIVAKITGGTPNDDKSYYYQWKNSTGVLQTTTAELKDGFYTITLNGVPADDYFLTIKDKNYSEGTNQIINCSVLESKVVLTEPDPLKVVFEIVRTISCNTNNEFGNDKDTTPKDGQRDESQDGILVAHVSGGTPLASSVNNGLPYYFYWKKQQADGSWIALPNITSETASNLSHGSYALNIKDRNGIMLGTYVNNILTQEIDVTQLMQEPPKLAVTITHGDVFCNGGNDGWATANVVGGTPPYDYKWSNEVDIDKNTFLKAGKYWVFITDAKGCTTQESVTILQPVAPLAIKYTEVFNPTFYKATNGKIVVEVTGGTILPDNSYWFEWKNSTGITQTTTTTSFSNGIFTISLNGLPEETYSLTVRDANYNAATNKISCTVANSITTLDDPDPLEVTFEVVRTISCNVSNEFGNEIDANPQDNQRDESQDGILVAHVKGGIQLKADKNNALPYFYTWKKQQKDGSWTIWNDQDETAENLSEGTYALNIEDANGIKLGTYVNNVLVKEVDVTQYMPEPAKLNLTFTKGNASCNNGDDGWAEAHISGGTPPYTYEWTNGETTARIENITTNNYFVIATDAKGCVVQGSIFVGDPKGIFTTETVTNPTCYSGNDGSIELNVTGGNLPYNFLWNTGATTKDLNNLVAGNYEVTISCTDCCVYKKKFILKDPNPIVVDLGKDRTLCNDQVLDLDVTISDDKAQYSWTSTNGFTSNQAKVSLTKSGTYTVKVTSALGCIGEDEIIIKTNQMVISSEFLLSSQAYSDEEVILVNTSNPFGESTHWILPKGVSIVEQKEKYITLKFDTTGIYTIGLQQTQGDCFATYNKNITVEKRSTLPNAAIGSKFIIDFIVTPNPSNGNFKAIVTLENNSAINLRLFSTTGEFTTQKKDSGKKKYEVDFNTSLPSGMYILVLETEQQTLVKKIIIY
ncbi:T9SS type A sorting domain-containing protein [Flavobacterium sp. F-65]|uniref:T9SS type A sorting domain-containing protein n=1 Tax=Flavobacterium pisciphilum TaxID=2893755 RepID=A0ABS8MXM3_9FLAO|nr:T9SS type A sorting domain-containing protein [Flavobacterium sp. F-65]MCC9073524.1 T9SS type A sorting domain-containing protein [Flavobacterium sp. F-65]